ncbi:MAG: ABC transporter permease [Oscillospiraceae bacterium]
MIENIRLSFQGIWSHKMRSFLTMLGIIIGIASIISIVSTIKGTSEQIKNNLIGSGSNNVKVQLYQTDWPYEMTYNGVPSGIPVISEEVRQQMEALPDVVSASLYQTRNDYGSVFYNNKPLSGCEIVGADANYMSTCGYRILKGRNFVPEDFQNFRTVTVLDKTTADSLFFGEEPIGKTIEISGVPFTVIGVVQETTIFEPVINTIDDYYMYMGDKTGKLFLTSAAWPGIYHFDEPQNVVLKATNTESMAIAGKSVADLLNAFSTNKDDIKYKAENLLQKAKELQDLSNSTNQQLIWIASISLLVGGIGVMNIMLVSVTERTREIGLKKAIGARKKKILWQFLTEAAVLTSLGGIIGVGVGIGMAQIVSRLTSAPTSISIPSIAIAVLFSMVIGIIFGLIPSIKAANLDPIDALRHE